MRNTSFEKGNYYHIFNRGVDKRDIFLNDNDKWRFLQGLFLFNSKESTGNILWQMERKRGEVIFSTLKDFFTENKEEKEPIVLILAYCLKENHFHLLLKEIEEGGIQSFMHKLGSSYAKYFNNKQKRQGVLFQGSFKAVRIESDKYLQYLLAYINIVNPAQEVSERIKEEGIERKEEAREFIEKFPWSTHQEYLGKRNSIIIEKEIFENIFPTPKDYEKFTDMVLSAKEDVWRAEHLFLE